MIVQATSNVLHKRTGWSAVTLQPDLDTQAVEVPDMSERDLPDIEYLRQRLRYEPDTGKLFWKAHPALPAGWNTRWAGTEAFTATRNTGYKHGRVDAQAYQAHRVVWALVHGVWPTGQLDHIDHDPINNRIANLRVVDHQENQRNASLGKNNTSGVTGVSWYKAGARWTAYIMVDRVKTHLGYFTAFDDAVAARRAAEREFGFHANHGIDAIKQPVSRTALNAR